MRVLVLSLLALPVLSSGSSPSQQPSPPLLPRHTHLVAQQDTPAQQDSSDSSNSSFASVPTITPSRFSLSRFDPLQILVGAFLKLFVENPDILRVGKSTIATVIYTYVAVSIAGTFGVDTKAILSLLSISGLTLGLAVQNVLGQIFAGLFLVLFCPFKRGWVISVDNYTGKVLSVDTRYSMYITCF